METINNIAVFDNDKCFLAMLKGYCYADNIRLTEVAFNREGINTVERLKPELIILSVDTLNDPNKSLEAAYLRRLAVSGPVKVCGLIRNSIDIVSDKLSEWVDILSNPSDVGEIDRYLKRNFILNIPLVEKRQIERRSCTERRNAVANHNEDDDGKKQASTDCQHESKGPNIKDFYIDRRNKCVLVEGHKVDLTRKEFELIDLLSTNADRVFMADEIINHLWPENNRATKSDLYQYMHLLRKKIEKDPNNPHWILTVKGFGYKLNTISPEAIYQERRVSSASSFQGWHRNYSISEEGAGVDFSRAAGLGLEA